MTLYLILFGLSINHSTFLASREAVIKYLKFDCVSFGVSLEGCCLPANLMQCLHGAQHLSWAFHLLQLFWVWVLKCPHTLLPHSVAGSFLLPALGAKPMAHLHNTHGYNARCRSSLLSGQLLHLLCFLLCSPNSLIYVATYEMPNNRLVLSHKNGSLF